MGVTYNLRCRRCGHGLERNYGVGVNGQGTLYCDRCGRAQQVDFSGGWACVPACECGGTFDAEALGCCPQCGAVLTKEDIIPDENASCVKDGAASPSGSEGQELLYANNEVIKKQEEIGSEGQELLYTNNEVINKLEVIDGE